jgi:hypothetical protein
MGRAKPEEYAGRHGLKPLPLFQRVIMVDPIDDPQAEYDRLKSIGALPQDELFDRYKLQDAINEAARHSHQARLLHTEIRKRAERYRRACGPKLAELRRRALRMLTDWIRVEDASRRKTVTDEMVMDQLHSSPDLDREYCAVMDNLGEMDQVVEASLSLAYSWRDRMSLLQSMASALPKMDREWPEEKD